MKLYVIMEDIDDWAECGGGVSPTAVFLVEENAQKYAKEQMKKRHSKKYSYYVETWNTAD